MVGSMKRNGGLVWGPVAGGYLQFPWKPASLSIAGSVAQRSLVTGPIFDRAANERGRPAHRGAAPGAQRFANDRPVFTLEPRISGHRTEQAGSVFTDSLTIGPRDAKLSD
jgi:hypothetical protein